jgi:hypothetical protein
MGIVPNRTLKGVLVAAPAILIVQAIFRNTMNGRTQ